MTIWDKLAVLLCIYTAVPFIIALLYKKINKHGFVEGFLYSIISMLIMPVAMEGLGSKEFSLFILSKADASENILLAIFRLVAFAVVFCLGGSSFISRVYKIVTGQELPGLEKLEAKVTEQIEAVKLQSDNLAVAVVSGSIGNTQSSKDDMRELLLLIKNTDNPFSISVIPEDKKSLLREVLEIGAVQSIVDEKNFETKLVISELGMRILEENKTPSKLP